MTATLDIVRTDITKLTVDAIVNAANESMLGGGGVDGAIHRAAGPQLLDVCRHAAADRNRTCAARRARRASRHGFKLPAKFVIHTVGPIWHGGSRGEADLLASCYRESLKLAAENSVRRIAFPAISCGVYGYPIIPAAQIAVRECRAFEHASIEKILFVCFNADIERAYREALDR